MRSTCSYSHTSQLRRHSRWRLMQLWIWALTSRKLSLICCSARRTPPIASSKSLRASQHLKRGSLLVEQPLWSCEVLILHLVPFNAKYGVSSLKAVVTHATFQAPQHFLGAQLPKKDCVCSSRKAAAARSLRFASSSLSHILPPWQLPPDYSLI